jgi:ribosome-binding factor A
MTRRIEQVNQLLRREISALLQNKVRDPRVNSFVAVTEVDTSHDLRYAKVFISHLGTEEEKKEILKALKSASGFFRHELAERIELRRIPELTFIWDSSIEQGDRIARLLNRVDEEPKPPAGD